MACACAAAKNDAATAAIFLCFVVTKCSLLLKNLMCALEGSDNSSPRGVGVATYAEIYEASTTTYHRILKWQEFVRNGSANKRGFHTGTKITNGDCCRIFVRVMHQGSLQAGFLFVGANGLYRETAGLEGRYGWDDFFSGGDGPNADEEAEGGGDEVGGGAFEGGSEPK